jgi:hypothetical protein
MQYLLKTGGREKSRDQGLMAASPFAKRSQGEGYVMKSTLRSGGLDQGVALHF